MVKKEKLDVLTIPDNNFAAELVIANKELSLQITERKHMEHALKESIDKFMSLADNITGYIAYINADSLHYEFVNDMYVKSYGIPREKII